MEGGDSPDHGDRGDDRWHVEYGDGNEQHYAVCDHALLAANDAGARERRNVENNTSAEGD